MVDYTNFDLYTEETVDKQLVISFDGGTITNEDLHQEEFELTESLCSDSQLTFGSCEASEVKFRISNVFTSLKDKWLTITQILNGDTENPLQIGKYKVYSDKPTADRSYRDIAAYDVMYDIINADVVAWYNGLTFPMSQKAFRNSFFAFFGIEQEEVALVNDDMTIEKTVEPSVLSGKDVIQSICELNGCFGHIGRDGKFQYIHLENSAQGLYPSNDLYPAEDLFPIQSASTTVEKSLYISCEYEDFISQSITKLQIREKEGDVGGIAGEGDNSYIIEDNFLLYGKSTDELNSIAAKTLEVIGKASYRPFKAEIVGNPCFEVGDAIRLFTKYEIIETYILNRTLSGIQGLRDDFSADGEEYFTEKVNDIQTSITQLKGKTNTLERTIEETRSTITDVESGLQSQITQTAESITHEVSKTYTTKDELGNYSTTEEMNSAITQTAESITHEVSKTYTTKDELGNYSTTEEMNSAITQTAESITHTVAETQSKWDTSKYDESTIYFGCGEPVIELPPVGTYTNYLDVSTGKFYTAGAVEGVGKKWFEVEQLEKIETILSSEIEQLAGQIVLSVNAQGKIVSVELSADPENGSAFSVGADNIDLSAEEVISLMAGGNLDLSGKNITITSDNFSVDKEGNTDLTGSVHATKFNVDEKITLKSGWVFDSSGATFKDVLYTEQETIGARVFSLIHAAISYIEGQLTINGILNAMYGIHGGVTHLTELTVSGTKSRLASTENYNDRLLYCYEMPSPFFGDIGHGTIGEDGLCYVDIDSIFAETIDTIQEYYVFLTPYKTDKAMFIQEKEHGYFVVQGEPGTEFDWEIKAKQSDFPMERLEENVVEETTNDIDYEQEAINYLNEYEKELTEV